MNRTELYVKRFYQSINIFHPHQLTICKISSKLNLSIVYWPHSSEIALYNSTYKMFINEKLNNQQRWQEFGHEIGHHLHEGSQTNMDNLFLNYQESQAEYFSYHFCVPTFMLANLKEVSVDVITNLFNVEYDFAIRRLEMYQSKLLSRRNKGELLASKN